MSYETDIEDRFEEVLTEPNKALFLVFDGGNPHGAITIARKGPLLYDHDEPEIYLAEFVTGEGLFYLRDIEGDMAEWPSPPLHRCSVRTCKLDDLEQFGFSLSELIEEVADAMDLRDRAGNFSDEALALAHQKTLLWLGEEEIPHLVHP